MKLKIILFIFLLSTSLIHSTVVPIDKKNYTYTVDNTSKCKVRNIGTLPNETIQYKGDCLKGYANGSGTLIWYANGKFNQSAKGTFSNGVQHGKGSRKWANGKSYTGFIAFGQPHGTGKLTNPDGSIIEGVFDKGEVLVGTHILKNGMKYQGQFRWDQYAGTGTLTWPSGQKYTGSFWRGEQTKGTLHKINGEIYEGEFKRGLFHGVGQITYKDGKVMQCIFEKGKCSIYTGGNTYRKR